MTNRQQVLNNLVPTLSQRFSLPQLPLYYNPEELPRQFLMQRLNLHQRAQPFYKTADVMPLTHYRLFPLSQIFALLQSVPLQSKNSLYLPRRLTTLRDLNADPI